MAWDSMTMPKYKGGLRFRDIVIFNLSLLVRQVWHIISEPGTLSAKVLKSVYFPSCDIFSAEVGWYPSQIWRSLCEGRDMLKQGLIRRIGDVKTQPFGRIIGCHRTSISDGCVLRHQILLLMCQISYVQQLRHGRGRF